MKEPRILSPTGWQKYSTWENSSQCRKLYERRCQKLEVEMTCAAQAADILASVSNPHETLLDVGCASGYFFHSLKSRNIQLEYFGIDSCEEFIRIGKQTMSAFGLKSENIQAIRLEDLETKVDHVLCMNTLTYLDNYFRPLEKMLLSANKTVILRESFKDAAEYLYVEDKYLDGDRPLKVPINHYSKIDIISFMESYGFDTEFQIDRRTGGQPELVIDHPHYWTFCIGRKRVV
jgi:hypothetical protein